MDDLRPITVLAQQDQGRVREQQEDRCLAWAEDDVAFLIVADGMGGHSGGALASRYALETVEAVLHDVLVTVPSPMTSAPTAPPPPSRSTRKLPETLTDEDDREVAALLHEAMDAAQEVLQNMAAMQPPIMREAGSTLTVALLIGNRAHIAHVGDSRAYHWQAPILRPLTHDHSAAALLVAAGAISAAEARHHPERSTLYQFIGSGKPLVVELVHTPFAAGDLLLLCSDGLWAMVPDDEIAALLGRDGTLAEIAQALIDTANANGGEDNIAVALARLG